MRIRPPGQSFVEPVDDAQKSEASLGRNGRDEGPNLQIGREAALRNWEAPRPMVSMRISRGVDLRV